MCLTPGAEIKHEVNKLFPIYFTEAVMLEVKQQTYIQAQK